ncbi:CRISPR-associated endonuclease Cas2 [Salinarimonas sp. NSM]|uniref:CRISPR-associated endonuclease Cas2 n=1 Tax=Salinarimonas sp. NSM TaxID=3458003 RepID=UPI0040355A0E
MAREHLYVFAYDIARDSARARAHDILAEHLVRIQKSVFEGRMSERAARRLVERLSVLVGEQDSLRVWAVTADGLAASFARGRERLPEEGRFFLF